MDWNSITDGLTLSIFGMLTTFLALGLFILCMLLLRWLFPAEKRRRPVVMPTGSDLSETAEPSGSAEEEELITAVTAAAMMLHQTIPQPGLDAAAEAAAAAAAAWWLKEQRGMSPTIPLPGQTTRSRSGLGARLEDRRGRWWNPLNGD